MSMPYKKLTDRMRAMDAVPVFCFSWLLLFVLYLSAAKAGFVADFTGWLDQVKNHGFWENINRTNFHVHSLYQFTQFSTYVFYKLFGVNAWLWHLLFISLHSLNVCLVYVFCSRLLSGAGITRGKTVALAGCMLFCVSPYISEVVVWEPSYHFLQGLMLILLILVWVQKYLKTGRVKYASWAGVVYFLSTFSLEIFYITPWLVIAVALFYRHGAGASKDIIKKTLRLFFLPELAIFLLHLVVYRLAYGSWVSHISSNNVTAISVDSFGKPAKYIFHLLFLGRFFPTELRLKVYEACDSMGGIAAFYCVAAVVVLYILLRFRTFGGKGKVASLLFVFTMITLALLIPLWFPQLLLVINDRYTYFTLPFFYMLVVILASFISVAYIRVGIIALYSLVNLRFAIKVSRYWGKSERVIYGLLHHLPPEQHKTIVLLNIPQSMNGVAMIGAEKSSEYQLMHDLLLPGEAIKTKLYDAMAYNMLTPTDGAHATVLNDSTVRVTLNQWGTWWWFETKGGYGYENSDYKINMTDPGHTYDIILKKPATQYLLLYEAGDQWKAVDMSKTYDQY